MFRVENDEATLETDNIQSDTFNLTRINDNDTVETVASITSSLNENNGGHLAFSTRENGGQLRPVFEINDHGAIAFNGSYGTAGQLLQTNGQISPPTWVNHTEPPYHLVLGLGDFQGGSIYNIGSNQTVVLHTLYIREDHSINTDYNGDLSNGTTWSPSISGIFQITQNVQPRSYQTINGQTTDRLAETSIRLQKLVNGSWETIINSTDRRWGSSVNETNASTFSNNNVFCQTVYATPNDTFRWVAYGRSYFANAIWILTHLHSFKTTITKINSIRTTVLSDGLLNFNDNITIESVSRIAGSLDGTNGGQLQLFTKPNTNESTPFTERMTILGNGHVGIGTTTPEALFQVNGNSRTNRLIVDALESFSGTRNYIHLQSGDISLSAESKSSNGNNYKEFIIRGWVNPDNSEVDGAGATTSSHMRNHMFGAHLFNTGSSYASLYVKNTLFLAHNSNGPIVTLYYDVLAVASDDRLKHNEINISDSLEVIRKLTAKSYDKAGSLDDLENTFHSVGFIAQDVYTIPQLESFVDNPETSDNPEHDGIWKLNYEPIFIYTTQAVKELDIIIQRQKEEINNLKYENTLLESTLNIILTEMGKETI